MEWAISGDPPFIEWMSEGARVRGAVGLPPLVCPWLQLSNMIIS